MQKKIAILKGDGIGPEVVDQAIDVLQAIAQKYGHEFLLEEGLIGASAIYKTGQPLPDNTIELCMSSDAILLGAIGDPSFDNNPEATVRPEQGLLALRKSLELFANIRPIKVYKGLEHLSPLKEHLLTDVDLVIYRELTGGIYFGKKEKEASYSSDLCIYHDFEIKRICALAFQEAQRRDKKLCLIDKANVLESSRLWRKVVQEMSLDYVDVEVSYLFIDNAAMQMIINPSQFDVIVTSNMFGDIISDEASVLGGSLGLLPSASYGSKYRLYEPVHGSYPQATGKDIANPLATILSVAMMLQDFGMKEEADDIYRSVEKSISSGYVTNDLDKSKDYKCSEVGAHILTQILQESTITL
jgi:3-isopropylmalate dehydrogenase